MNATRRHVNVIVVTGCDIESEGFDGDRRRIPRRRWHDRNVSPSLGHCAHRRLTGAVAAFVVVIAGCSGSGERSDAARFCGEIEANQAALTAPALTNAVQVEALLDLYREIGQFAPLAIEAEWDQLIVNYETASTVVPGNEASRQAAIATALQSEQSAARVKTWLVENCALDIGPVDTLVQQDR